MIDEDNNYEDIMFNYSKNEDFLKEEINISDIMDSPDISPIANKSIREENRSYYIINREENMPNITQRNVIKIKLKLPKKPIEEQSMDVKSMDNEQTNENMAPKTPNKKINIQQINKISHRQSKIENASNIKTSNNNKDENQHITIGRKTIPMSTYKKLINKNKRKATTKKEKNKKKRKEKDQSYVIKSTSNSNPSIPKRTLSSRGANRREDTNITKSEIPLPTFRVLEIEEDMIPDVDINHSFYNSDNPFYFMSSFEDTLVDSSVISFENMQNLVGGFNGTRTSGINDHKNWKMEDEDSSEDIEDETYIKRHLINELKERARRVTIISRIKKSVKDVVTANEMLNSPSISRMEPEKEKVYNELPFEKKSVIETEISKLKNSYQQYPNFLRWDQTFKWCVVHTTPKIDPLTNQPRNIIVLKKIFDC
eukprot:TRINITY_DN3605_c0_g1_i1.p1 TRINITY_DN3605_c0_g1~~TRINITY_DN3605_c0_g1_i1.p1  ORF type:complete len:426 (-),score=103.82 TRINITY_DN3605_c0_g1_i1:105-1382(-)